MSQVTLSLSPLTRESFSPYGEVIEISSSNHCLPINYGQTVRHHGLAKVDVESNGGFPIISMFQSKKTELPFRLRVMERHPLGSQAIIPLGNHPYAVIVAEGSTFTPSNMRAFLAEPGQGVNIFKGVWHHFNLSLEGDGSFVVVDREGQGDNCEEVGLPLDMKYFLVE